MIRGTESIPVFPSAYKSLQIAGLNSFIFPSFLIKQANKHTKAKYTKLMIRQKNHFSSHHDPKLSHSEYTIGSDSFSTRDTFRCGDGNTRCETVGDLHGSCVN